MTSARRLFFRAGINVLLSAKAEFPLKTRHARTVFLMALVHSAPAHEVSSQPRITQITRLRENKGATEQNIASVIPLTYPCHSRYPRFDFGRTGY
jgi:hypothetical protein